MSLNEMGNLEEVFNMRTNEQIIKYFFNYLPIIGNQLFLKNNSDLNFIIW